MALRLKLLFLLAMFCVLPAVQAQSVNTTAPKKEDLPYWARNLNAKASHYAKPVYSQADLPVNTFVRIEVLTQINEKGDVLSAKAYSGPEPEALRRASETAALQYKFTPFEFEGKIRKAVGLLIFYFPEIGAQEFKENIETFKLSVWISSEFPGIPFMSESWVKDVNKIDPTIMADIEKHGGYKQAPPEKAFTMLVDDVSARLEKKMKGQKLWYFLLGRKLGKITAEFWKQGQLEGEHSDANIRLLLNDLKEYSKTLPSGFPRQMSQDLRSLTALSDHKELKTDEGWKLIGDRAGNMLDDMGTYLAEFN